VYREPNGELLILGPNALGSTFLLLVIGMMVVAAGAALLRTVKEELGREFKFDREIRIGTVVAVALFVFFTPPPYSVTVADDFHLGETLIPWQQLTVFGQRLYTDFVSVQGVLGLSYGAINEWLFAGTVATYPIAAFWMLAIANGVTAIAICRTIGSGWGLILAPITFTMLDRVLLVPLLFLLLASRWATSSAARWIAMFVTVAALHFLWIPSTGTAFALSGAVFFIAALFLVIQNARLGSFSKREVAHVIGAVALVAAIAPFLGGALSFVTENGSTNAVAYGVMIEANHLPPNFPRWFGDPFFDMLVWEGIRFGGWLVGAFGLLTIAALAGRTAVTQRLPQGNRIAAILILGIGGAAFAYALIPYSAGRIDGGGLSRSGCITLLLFGFFIPMVVALYKRSIGVFPLALTVLGLLLGVRFAYAPPTLGYLVERANQIVQIPGDAVNVTGSAQELPNLGGGYVTARTWDEITRLRQALAVYLKDGETYFDLTNRSAFYFFLGKRVPSPYSADYLAANGAIQNRIVERLERERPPVAWVGPVMRFDESPTAIRSYRVLRWFLESGYRYESAFGNQFLVRPDRLVGEGAAERLHEIESGLSRSDLAALPNAWGRNYSRLESRFVERAALGLLPPESGLLLRENNWLELRASRPQFRWAIPASAGMAEARPDYLLVELSRRGPQRRLRGELLWSERTADGSRPDRSTNNDQPSWTADGSRPGRSSNNDQPSWTADGSRPDRSTNNDQTTPVGGPPSEFKRGTGITFQVKPGVLLIPLGSQLRWHRDTEITDLRLELTGESVGSKLRIERATLLRLVR
jgi:hypothetical protein